MIKQESSLNGQESRARINGARWIPDPPHRSTFKRGGPESQAQLSDSSD
jgi:hypothetical protein